MSRRRSRHEDRERDREHSRSPRTRDVLQETDTEKRREKNRERESGSEDDIKRSKQRVQDERPRVERYERRAGEGDRGHKRERGERRGEDRRRRGEGERRSRDGDRADGRDRPTESDERARERRRGGEGGRMERRDSGRRLSDVGRSRESERESTQNRRDDQRRQRREQRMKEDEKAKNLKFGGSREESGGKEEEVNKKEEPNFALSGKLTAETNTYRGVVIKYSEPAEARQPTTRWRLYQFKGDEVLPTLYIHRQSAYLIGRDRRVVDLPVDHPSCSGQHAVLQYRLVSYEKKDGSVGKRVKPYLIDLESTNGTFINNQKIEPARYWELKEQDMIKFGFSSREYVILHENSKDSDASPATAAPAADDDTTSAAENQSRS